MEINKYSILKKEFYNFNTFSITSLRKGDIFKIKDWRNSQLEILRQKQPLTDTDQENYFNNKVVPTFRQEHPKIMLFSFLRDSECVGYGGLTNIDWESLRCELSFLVDPNIYYDNEQYEISFTAFISMIKSITFDELNFNRIFTETYDIRPFHIRILEKNGFLLEGRMLQHVFIDKKLTDSLIHGFLKKYYV